MQKYLIYFVLIQIFYISPITVALPCWNMKCYFYHYLLIMSQIPFLSEPFLCINPLSCNFLIIQAIVALDNLATCISA